MTPSAYRAVRERLGLTPGTAALLLGVRARGERSWSSGEHAVPAPVERLLWACERDPGLVALLLGRKALAGP